MARYIDADALMDKLDFELARWLDSAYEHNEDKSGLVAMREAIYDVIHAPTADVAPVVRCKDCKWWNSIGCAIQIVSDSDKPKADDFCSFGERKDDENH